MKIGRLWDSLFTAEAFRNRRVLRRLCPLEFRPVTEADFGACMALHEVSECGYLPAAHRPIFREALESGSMLMLLAYRKGHREPVACCGLQRSAEALYWLCYGLVHPQHRGQGIGTTLFFTRMGLLASVEPPEFTVGMAAIAENFPFYARLGFYSLSHVPNPCSDGNNYPLALLENMSPEKALIYRERAIEAGVELDSWDMQVPARRTEPLAN